MKKFSIGKILGIVAAAVAFITIFMSFAPAVKGNDDGSFFALVAACFEDTGFSKAIGAGFIMLIIGVFALTAVAFMPNAKIAGIVKLCSGVIVLVSAILAFCTIASCPEVFKEGAQLGAGPILVGVFGIIASGLGITSGIMNLKK